MKVFYRKLACVDDAVYLITSRISWLPKKVLETLRLPDWWTLTLKENRSYVGVLEKAVQIARGKPRGITVNNVTPTTYLACVADELPGFSLFATQSTPYFESEKVGGKLFSIYIYTFMINYSGLKWRAKDRLERHVNNLIIFILTYCEKRRFFNAVYRCNGHWTHKETRFHWKRLAGIAFHIYNDSERNTLMNRIFFLSVLFIFNLGYLSSSSYLSWILRSPSKTNLTRAQWPL